MDESNADAAFEEVISFAAELGFRNCTHLREPDCAVQAALAEGLIDASRLKSYLKLRREEERLKRKTK